MTPDRTGMHVSAMPSRTVHALLVLVLLAPATAAADWRYLEAQREQAVQPDHYRFAPDGSLWTFAGDGVYRTGSDGATALLHRSALGTDKPGDLAREGVLLDDGGALLDVGGISHSGGYCALQRIDAQRRATWRVDIPLQYETCRGLFANAAGQSWLAAGEKLYPVAQEGALQSPVALTGATGYARRPVAVAPDGSAIAATRLRGANGTRLSRFLPGGGERWSWVREDQRQLDLVTLAGDGIVAVVAELSQGFDREVSRWSGDGVLQWSRPFDSGDVSVLDVVAAAKGDVYVVIGPNQFNARRVQRIGIDGTLRWQRDLNCDSNEPAPRRFALTPADGLALVCATAGGAQLLRLDRDGAATALALPLHHPRQVVRQSDGRLLLLGQRDAGVDPLAKSIVVDGDAIDAAPLDGYRRPAPSALAGQQILPDGTVYLAAAAIDAGDDPRFTLSRVSPAGERLWTRELRGLPGELRNGFAAGAGRVCVVAATAVAPSQPSQLICLDAADGSESWSQNVLGDFALAGLFVAGNGRVLFVRSKNDRHEVLRYSNFGVLEAMSSGAGGVTRAVVDAAGRVSVTTSAALIQYAIDGSTSYRVEAADAALRLQDSGYLQGAASAPDGSLWLAGRRTGAGESQRSVWAIDRDGRTRWVRDLGEFRYAELVRGDDAIYALQWTPMQVSTDPAGAISRVTKLRASDGAVAWTYESSDPPSTTLSPAGGRIALSADGSALVMAHSWGDRLRLQRIAGDSGQRKHEQFVACLKTCAQPAELALDAQGTARIVFDALDAGRGQSAAIIATDLSANPTRLDQPGIAGAWWSPYANGEGITFDWLPASRTLFGAWFTYSTTGGNDPGELRWYTVQANGVAEGARRIELPILETVGGNFDAGPAVAPRRVGTAQVEFYDCTRGTIHYAFEAAANGGRSGTITLSRLSPATQPCVLADGSNLPGADAQPPANGFDAKLSGTWFDEATTGQGLHFTVQPGGVFFAPWFTFDPADAGNDAGRQHWFTLQGDLADARDGTAQLVLVQTLGGAFDRVPTYNANAIGTATVRILGCDRAELDYRYADASVAGAFRARSGTLRLTRAGGCAL